MENHVVPVRWAFLKPDSEGYWRGEGVLLNLNKLIVFKYIKRIGLDLLAVNFYRLDGFNVPFIINVFPF